MHKGLVTVLIPIYKEELTPDEYTSLRRCICVLSEHPITLVCPESLVLDKYFLEYSDFKVETFRNVFFKSIDGYNKLMMSRDFYKRFLKYKYILIYQLDAYVFRDELNYWCSQNIDYIGAPIVISSEFENTVSTKYLKVGNGGLSLRNTISHYNSLRYSKIHKIVKWMYETWEQSKFIKPSNSKNTVRFFKTCLLKATGRTANLKELKMNEDGYWSFVVPRVNWNFKVASIDQAMRFAFEKNPEVLFKMNKSQLPFGCHAWQKYNTSFWREYI